jgi:hypothetical protein
MVRQREEENLAKAQRILEAARKKADAALQRWFLAAAKEGRN